MPTLTAPRYVQGGSKGTVGSWMMSVVTVDVGSQQMLGSQVKWGHS